MSETVEKPKRAFEVEIRVGGDTWEDVARHLRDLMIHIEDHGPRCSSVSGGPSVGSYVDIVERPEMTHERYHEELERYLRRPLTPGSNGGGKP